MRKSLPLLAVLLSGCLSSKVAPGTPDPAILVQLQDGQVVLSSLDSAPQTRITRQQQVGDTLFVTYKKVLPLYRRDVRPAQFTIALTEQIHYVKCANLLYRVEKMATGFRLEQI
ncbi:hypothetical protein [Hymenobacter cellulosivorans]|uniref:Lipoprotein n=1 Tax=Hymenobacter cellulosivorans TaxID=2932249 RepID=A0ABY4FB71_9BACT|nr:hypothetical protein [Hymenobacter cellulosivorans]UOQ53917.1 hypothetical protein MUN80_03940 [Hymenobacter cellulosivorans]